jgi:hypothetical protein
MCYLFRLEEKKILRVHVFKSLGTPSSFSADNVLLYLLLFLPLWKTTIYIYKIITIYKVHIYYIMLSMENQKNEISCNWHNNIFGETIRDY